MVDLWAWKLTTNLRRLLLNFSILFFGFILLKFDMPKVLSLKKSQLSASQKNQKPITQFFKNERSDSSVVSSQTKQTFDNFTEKQAGVKDKIPSKRKASSPVLLDNNGYLNEVNQDKNTKKVKTASKLRSPKKENHEYLKECNLNNKINSLSQDENLSKGRDPLENIIDRPPFTLIVENDGHSNGKVKLSPVKAISNYDNNITPESNHDDNLHNVYLIHKSSYTSPTKCPVKEKSRSPGIVTKFLTSQEVSPSKCRSTNKALSSTDTKDVGDMFEDEWEINNIGDVMNDIDQLEDLDLRTMQRCEILNIVNHATKTEMRLKNDSNHRGTCYIEGVWLETPLCPGDTVGVIASHDAAGQYCVSNTSGLLVLRPDYLMSSTSVVAGVFCKRKAVLQERWRGLDSANAAMTIGIIIHELVQKALTRNITDVTQLRLEAERIIKESVQLLYDAGLSEEEVRKNMQLYISPLGDFMNTYFTGKSSTGAMQQGPKDNWRGNINKVLDIEENLCCPQLGLKGKIDATLDVTSHTTKGDSRQVVPLELKSGKASMSAEHRGQLVLYGMMLSVQRGEDPTSSQQRGLLLYLKDRVELRDVSCGYPERRDLVILRNQLVQNLAAGPEDVDPEQLVDIEDASSLLQQKLPEPIHRENVCSKCPYLTICSLHLWHTNGPSVSESHPLSKMRDSALGHLSQDHIKYFMRWTTLLKMEEKGQAAASPLHTLWTDSVEKREKRGTCFANVHLKSVEGSGVKFLHIFQKPRRNLERTESESRGPQEGEFCLVSVDGRPWVAAGVIVSAKDDEIHMALERDLSQRMAKTTAFHIDTYESYGTTVQNLTNLGVLLEDTDRSQRLRRLIIDREVPAFEVKLPREVGRLGTKLMRALNIDQQRAVLRALAAKDYALLQGLPGTGKTQTISVLIQMLVRLQRRVLVTAHTHSAVDTVLSRLPDSIRIMRLGAKSRVAENLVSRCEQQLAADCETPQQLEQLYDSMEVVGVTCLGATHAMLSKTTFDVCIVDEATQVLQSTVLRPLFAAKRFVLVGDPNQLPPLVKSKAARRLGMEESLFHRLMTEATTSTLHLQYRMNQRLADVANKVAYGGQLRCAGKELAQSTLDIDLKKISHLPPWLATACSPAPEQAAAFIDLSEGEATDACRKTCANNTEACLVIAIAHALKEGGVKHSAIGVVAPYRDQVSLLRRSLAGSVEVSTVDQFQGRDKPVIIYSCTRNDKREETKVKEGEVLNDQRRLAVSVTRAKLKLIVVGNSRALRRYAPLQRLIDACAVTVLQKNDIKHMIQTYGSQVL